MINVNKYGKHNNINIDLVNNVKYFCVLFNIYWVACIIPNILILTIT